MMRKRLWAYGGGIVILFFLVFSLIRVYRVSEISMDYGLVEGDLVVVDNWSAGVHLPSWFGYTDRHIWSDEAGIHRGDLLAFRHPLDNRLYLKRCVALPGDTLFQDRKHLYLQLESNATLTRNVALQHGLETLQRLDGVWLVDPYRHYCAVTHDLRVIGPPILITYPVTRIRPHRYFMMGDLRDNSTGSRFFGAVPYDNIYYKVRYIMKRTRSMDTLGAMKIFQDRSGKSALSDWP